MKHLFITGTSSGIGKALAEYALEQGDRVTGISRRHTIHHHNYTHETMDLSKAEDIGKINFTPFTEATSAILVNNAGWLGEVKPVGQLHPDKIMRAFALNVSAPAVLCKQFLTQLNKKEVQKTVLNISSGVSRYAVPSWSTYCASKAALDMFTEVMKLDHPDVHCFSVAPGIVDTEMQGEIRRVNKQDFPDRDRFVKYKEKGELAQPKDVAKKLYHVLENPQDFDKVRFSLREV